MQHAYKHILLNINLRILKFNLYINSIRKLMAHILYLMCVCDCLGKCVSEYEW